MYQPAAVGPAGVSARIDLIANNHEKVRNEIIALRERERQVQRELQQKRIHKEIDESGYDVSASELRRTHMAMQVMDSTIMTTGLNDN